jgi:hypothetical protein
VLNFFYNYPIEDNPIKSITWFKSKTKVSYDQDHISELKAEGYTIVTIYNIPQLDNNEMPNFLFAKDRQRKQYYLHVNNFEKGWKAWSYLTIDVKVAIQFNPQTKTNTAAKATKIVEIDQYEE